MIRLTQDQCTVLDQLIEKNLPFVIYKMPAQPNWHFMMQTQGEVEEYMDLASLNGKVGYVIAPFQQQGACPILLLRPDIHQLPTPSELEGFEAIAPVGLSQEVVGNKDMFDSYCSSFQRFMKPLREDKAQKLVLSRCHAIELDQRISSAQAFEQACQANPNAYVYLLNTAQTGTWLGSTPELILSGNQNEWHTVALAGTKPIVNGTEQPWDAKNKLEQAYVAQYIQTRLEQYGVSPEVNGPVDITAGKVTHMVSHFDFKLSDRSRLGSLLKLLHPTPAVCGTPKEYAFDFIVEQESHNRKYYSGFLGYLDPQGQTNLYVNLRCMEINKKVCTLYAGGGLLATSQLEEEWNETENKMQTMKALLDAKKIS